MKIRIYSFGKIKNAEISSLIDYYSKLVSRYFQVEQVELKEISDRKVALGDIEKYFKNSHNIILSENGKEFSTKEFANKFQSWMNHSQDLNFFIGNAFGFEKAAKEKADLVLSFSQFTFPHEFVKVLLLEQLFRVGDILNNGRYHK